MGADLWRARLYQAGDVVNVTYNTHDLPDDETLAQDLRDVVMMYGQLVGAGGWEPDDQIARDAEEEAGIETLVEAKQYRLHRSIDRQPAHARAVKRLQGFRCRGCERQMDEIYGSIAVELIEAHHLFPLSALNEGETVTFSPETDFAVLCPNCHVVIHRMADLRDLEGLRKLLIN